MMFSLPLLFLFLLLPLLLFYPSPLLATIGMDISIVYKRHIDRDLVLVNELHSKETIDGEQKVFLKMRNGWSFLFSASFTEDGRRYGPSSKVALQGSIFNFKGELVKEFKSDQRGKELYSPVLYHYESKDQLIEIKVIPEVL